MSTLDLFVSNNVGYAADQTPESLMPSLKAVLPTMKALIVSCGDPRVDPARILGIRGGEALVLQNVGGRVTPALVDELQMLGRIGQVEGQKPGGGGEFHLIVMQHTDCGIKRLAGDAKMLSAYFGVGESELDSKAVNDPHAALAVDVATLKALPFLPAHWIVSGVVYDVGTGLTEVAIPPTTMR